jgi:hypothetical protein
MSEETNKLTKKTKLWLITIAIIAITILSMYILLISLRMMYKHSLQREQLEAREFLVQVIESVRNQTDFYKKKGFSRDIREIEIYKDKFSDNYKIKLIENELGYHTYMIIFGGENEFYIVITGKKGDFRYSHFELQGERFPFAPK